MCPFDGHMEFKNSSVINVVGNVSHIDMGNDRPASVIDFDRLLHELKSMREDLEKMQGSGEVAGAKQCVEEMSKAAAAKNGAAFKKHLGTAGSFVFDIAKRTGAYLIVEMLSPIGE